MPSTDSNEFKHYNNPDTLIFTIIKSRSTAKIVPLLVYILIFFIIIHTSFKSLAQDKTNKTEKPKIALVLSGGGAKGFAHIGVLKILEKEGIPIDLIVGTSMGSLVGGLYSIGYDASELEALVKSLDWETVLSDAIPREFSSKNDLLLKQRYLFSIPIDGENKPNLPQGLINGQNVLNILCGLAGNVPKDADFDEFPIQFACIAAELETGKEVVLKNGFLPTAMFSSMAIPIAFQSYDRDSLILIDGGLVNNFPTDVAKQLGADIIIGVDIRGDFYERNELNSFDNVLGQLVNFFDRGKEITNKSLCNIMIKPDVSGYSISSFNVRAADTLIRRGENATIALVEQIRELKIKYKLEPCPKSREMIKPNQWHITDLSFNCNTDFDTEFLKQTLNLKIPGDYSAEEIKKAIDRLYGLGGFNRIFYDLIDSEGGKILNLTISTRKVFTLNIGLKANTTDAAAILINATRKNYGKMFGFVSTSAELSINPGFCVIAETNKSNFPTVGFNFKSKYQNFNVSNKGSKISEADVFFTSGSVYLYQSFLKRFNLGIGLQEEYYTGDIFSKSDDNTLTTAKTNDLLTSAFSYLSFDNMDDYYFPTKGVNMYAEFSFLTDFNSSSQISPALLFKMQNVLPAWKKTTLLFDIYGRILDNEQYPQSKKTLIGGEPYLQYFNYHFPFVGISAVSIADRFTLLGLLGLRYQLSDSQYVSILFNALRQTDELSFTSEANKIYGCGIKYAIKTFLGPLEMTLGYSGSTGKPTFSANLGYWF